MKVSLQDAWGVFNMGESFFWEARNLDFGFPFGLITLKIKKKTGTLKKYTPQ